MGRRTTFPFFVIRILFETLFASDIVVLKYKESIPEGSVICKERGWILFGGHFFTICMFMPLPPKCGSVIRLNSTGIIVKNSSNFCRAHG